MAGIADLAHKVQSKGRDKDTHLLHVTSKELHGLQQLAAMSGGKLTRNPETGLYEAGFLEQLLPMAITAVASYFGGPMGGAIAGGITGAISHPKNPVMGGALGAVGGWGMGGLGDSLAQAGVDAASATAASESLAAMPADAATASPAFSLSDAATYGSKPYMDFMTGGPGAGAEFTTPSMAASAMGPSSVAQAGQVPDWMAEAGKTPYATLPDAYTAANYYTPQSAYGLGSTAPATAQPTWNYPQGKTALGPQPEETKWDQIVRGAKGIPDRPIKETVDKYGRNAFLSLMPLLSLETTNRSANPSGIPQTGMISPYSYSPGTMNPAWGGLGQPYFVNQGYVAGTPYRAAQGGLMDLAKGGTPSEPRMIQGPGTGLSDDIPATIEGGQKAALADGEFVVSSDVVSALGGGSTNAGAKKLYAMMDRVRSGAHGTKKQVKKLSDRKVLPA